MKLKNKPKTVHYPTWAFRSTSNEVCIACRKNGKRLLVCSQCGEETINIGKRWRVPRKSDDRGWANILAFPYVQGVLKAREEAKRGAIVSYYSGGASGVRKTRKKVKYSRRIKSPRNAENE